MDTTPRKGITVYCGSSSGNNPAYLKAAVDLGRLIAKSGLPLYYGGGHMGLMGAVGREVIKNGGTAVAVIPQFMVERGWNDAMASSTIVTDSMHSRKHLMANMALGAIALPGGIGTFEELSEIITWRQLGLYDGNIVVLNINGYYDSWIEQMHTAVREGFFSRAHLDLFHVADTAADAIERALTPGNVAIEPKFKNEN